MYYVYVLHSSKDGNLYTGATGDLHSRVDEHNNGKVDSRLIGRITMAALRCVVLTFVLIAVLCDPAFANPPCPPEVAQAIQADLKVKVTTEQITDTPVSEILCSNFIELGYGYQVETMWAEMLYNRSFEPWVQLQPCTYRWLGLKELDGDWRPAPWYHTGYEHNRW